MEHLPALPVHPMPSDAGAHDGIVVTGAVATERRFTAEDLHALGLQSLDDDFTCEEGWVAEGQRWRGVPLARLLDLAGADAGAGWLRVGAADFTHAITREEAREALVALELNGAALPLEHGGPARLVIPGGVCYSSIKWLDRVEVCHEPPGSTAREIALRRIGQEP